jgi:uncharacterized protein
MIRRSLLTLATGWALLSLHCYAQEAPRKQLAEELLNLLKVQENIGKSFEMVKQMLPAQVERMSAAAGKTNAVAGAQEQTSRMLDVIAKELSWENLKGDYVNLYADTFTEEELRSIIAFYRSPIGQTFIEKQPGLMKKSMELSQKLMLKLMPKIQALAKEQSAAEAPKPPARTNAAPQDK